MFYEQEYRYNDLQESSQTGEEYIEYYNKVEMKKNHADCNLQLTATSLILLTIICRS